MKKITALLLTALLSLSILTACGNTAEPSVAPPQVESIPEVDVAEPETVTADPVDMPVMAMSGATSMGMVYMMNENEVGNLTDNNYDFSIVTAIDEVTAQIVSGGAAIAAVPANVASALYNKTEGGVTVLAINTLGVLYIVESGDTVSSMADLEGKTIYAAGKGATPEYALKYLLEASGLTDSVTVEWKSEQAEVVAALDATENAIAMLPQPFATTALMENEGLRIALDLTAEWDATDSEGSLVTGVVVGNTAFVEANPDAVDAFLAHYETSINFVNEHLDEGAALVGQYGIVPEAVALQALPYCSITYMDGADMETALMGYYAALFAQNPASIGGAMPEADFFYGS